MHSSHALTKPSGLPDRLVVHVGGVGHSGKVEDRIDVVVLVVVSRVRGVALMTCFF